MMAGGNVDTDLWLERVEEIDRLEKELERIRLKRV